MILLAETPHDARVIEIIATGYARTQDDAGLKQFYLAQLDAVRHAPDLSPDERKQDIALLRRGLIPRTHKAQRLPGRRRPIYRASFGFSRRHEPEPGGGPVRSEIRPDNRSFSISYVPPSNSPLVTRDSWSC